MAAGLGLMAITSGLQTGFGMYQFLKGKKAAQNLVRPEYVIPEEIAQNLTAAQLAEAEGLPAEQKQAYIENIQRGSMGAMASLDERGLGVAGASGIFQQQSDAYRNLLEMGVATKFQARQDLSDARLTSASFKEREQDINKFQPYQEDYMAAQSMMGAGMQNVGLGVGSAAQFGMQEQQNKSDLEQLKAIYG